MRKARVLTARQAQGVALAWSLLAIAATGVALAAGNSGPAERQEPPMGSSPIPRTATPAGTVRKSPKDGLDYVWIPPGSFQMGCSPGDGDCFSWEKDPHPVTLKGFWMGRTEVTVGAYKRFASSAGRSMPPAPAFNPGWSKEDHPVVSVTWDEANGYCEWAGGRLPSEAEWEYAARGRTTTRYWWGDTYRKGMANCDESGLGGSSLKSTTAPGLYRANPHGLLDMLGNVWEWCRDRYHDSYKDAPGDGSAWESGSGGTRVLRGGSWVYNPKLLRVSLRDGGQAGLRLYSFGFRCVQDERPPEGRGSAP